MRTRGWRRIGTAIVRWPGAVLVASVAVALIGLLALPGYKTSYDARQYMPDWAPAKVGYAAAERHFSTARLNPEVLMVESDKDLRTPANMIVLEKVAKAVFRTPGVAMVQSITRPLGTLLDHTSLGFAMSAEFRATAEPAVPAGPRRRPGPPSRRISNSITLLQQQYTLQQRATAATDEQAAAFRETVATVRGVAGEGRQFRRLHPAAAQLLLLGSRTVTTSPSARRCGRCSTRSTASMR